MIKVGVAVVGVVWEEAWSLRSKRDTVPPRVVTLPCPVPGWGIAEASS